MTPWFFAPLVRLGTLLHVTFLVVGLAGVVVIGPAFAWVFGVELASLVIAMAMVLASALAGWIIGGRLWGFVAGVKTVVGTSMLPAFLAHVLFLGGALMIGSAGWADESTWWRVGAAVFLDLLLRTLASLAGALIAFQPSLVPRRARRWTRKRRYVRPRVRPLSL